MPPFGQTPYQFGPAPLDSYYSQIQQFSDPAGMSAGGSLKVPFSIFPDAATRDIYATQYANQTAGPKWTNPYAYQRWGTGLPSNAGFGAKLGNYLGGNAMLLMGGLQTAAGVMDAYTGLKGLSLAEDAFNQQKREFNINLANQTQSYNTQVADRIAGRHYGSEAERQAALDAATLPDRSKFGKRG